MKKKMCGGVMFFYLLMMLCNFAIATPPQIMPGYNLRIFLGFVEAIILLIIPLIIIYKIINGILEYRKQKDINIIEKLIKKVLILALVPFFISIIIETYRYFHTWYGWGDIECSLKDYFSSVILEFLKYMCYIFSGYLIGYAMISLKKIKQKGDTNKRSFINIFLFLIIFVISIFIEKVQNVIEYEEDIRIRNEWDTRWQMNK